MILSTVTILRKDGSTYKPIQVIKGNAFWYKAKVISTAGNGMQIAAEPSCIFPWSKTGKPDIRKHDILVLGEIKTEMTLKEINDLDDVITVKSISEHGYGSGRIQHTSCA